MTLNELSTLVQRVQDFPVEEIQKIKTEITKLTMLVKYTNHSKKLERYNKKLKVLNEFMIVHTIFTKEEE